MGLKQVGAADMQGVHESAVGPLAGHTRNIHVHIHIHSGMGQTFFLCDVCQNMEKIIILLYYKA